MSEAVPAFHLYLYGLQLLDYSRIAAGFITYSLVKVVKGQAKEVHSMIWILDVLFILNYVSMALN